MFPLRDLPLTLLVAALSYSKVANAYSSSFIHKSNSPESIIQKQLDALQQDDMYTVFKYASPSNKAATGPWQRFGKMVRSPPYLPLINHKRADVLFMTTRRDRSVKFLVRVWKSDELGNEMEDKELKAYPCPVYYEWILSKVEYVEDDSPYKDCYMVDGVMPMKI
ncbi:hypothetical protein CTEN210_13493 [Chaetoceros tenuissimus]|uniref:Uncharacterized protein n=1 Tax=Chaetoceros tenuissimus TaxID=426638 RepID=A0AAD3HAT7_9STRA|nr:hypothetical protein CTEN210_13493 [Chaetoceros tenuissimus]